MMWGIGMRKRRRSSQSGFILAEAVATVVITTLCIVGFAEGLFGALRASQRAASFYAAALKVENKFVSLNMPADSRKADSGDVEVKQQKWEAGAANLPVGLQETTLEFFARAKEDMAVLSLVTLAPSRRLVEEKTP